MVTIGQRHANMQSWLVAAQQSGADGAAPNAARRRGGHVEGDIGQPLLGHARGATAPKTLKYGQGGLYDIVHCTTKASLAGIVSSGSINESVGPKDCRHGQGVYTTTA